MYLLVSSSTVRHRRSPTAFGFFLFKCKNNSNETSHLFQLVCWFASKATRRSCLIASVRSFFGRANDLLQTLELRKSRVSFVGFLNARFGFSLTLKWFVWLSRDIRDRYFSVWFRWCWSPQCTNKIIIFDKTLQPENNFPFISSWPMLQTTHLECGAALSVSSQLERWQL